MEMRNRKEQLMNMIEAFDTDSKEESDKTLFLKASKIRAMFNSFLFTNSYKKNTLLAYVGDEFPKEILIGFNISSINMQTVAGLFSQTGKLNDIFMEANKYHLSKDVCSNIRGGFGCAFHNCIPAPNIVIPNTSPCNSSSKMISFMGEYYNVPKFLLETPRECNEDAIRFLADQFQDLIDFIEDKLGLTFDKEGFQEAIHNSNLAKEYFLKTLELCKENQLAAIQKELYEIIVVSMWGYKENVDICKQLYDEALDAIREGQVQNKQKRILWYGQVPTYGNNLIEYIREKSDLIFYTSLNVCHQMFIDENNILESMAERQINYTWDPFVKGDDLVNICDKYHIDGVILQNGWGCRNLIATNRIIRDKLVETKVKSIIIDSDFIDSTKFSYNQVKNRIDAFCETL